VFVTAYDQYAIDAFEQGVIDYVLKPAERERLGVTVERLRKRLAAPSPSSHALQQALARLAEKLEPASRLKWIQASVGNQIQMIPVDDVLFFVSDEKYTRVQTAQQEALIRKPIKELLAELDPAQFWQIHRSTLINTRAIAGIVRDERGRQLVAVKGRPEKLEVSRSYAHLFKACDPLSCGLTAINARPAGLQNNPSFESEWKNKHEDPRIPGQGDPPEIRHRDAAGRSLLFGREAAKARNNWAARSGS